jgi:hypothetical protein
LQSINHIVLQIAKAVLALGLTGVSPSAALRSAAYPAYHGGIGTSLEQTLIVLNHKGIER